MTEEDVLDSEDLEVEQRDVLAKPGEVIGNVDEVEARNVFDDSPRVPAVKPTQAADFREDFPEGAG